MSGMRHGGALRGHALRKGTLYALLALLLLAGSQRAGGDRTPQDLQGADGLASAGGDTVYVIQRKVTSANNVGLTIFTNGFFGNNLASRGPSFEYPLGSAQEHLVRAGPWIGGLKQDRDDPTIYDTLVTTATVDGRAFGEAARGEFTPELPDFVEKSILPNNRYYNPEAKSEQDLFIIYNDLEPFEGDDPHVPLGVRVEQEILQFSFEPFDAIVLVNMKLINANLVEPIFDLYAGFYAELATGWKDQYADWPPGGVWFDKKDIFYVDSLRLITEHHFNLDFGRAPAWAGYKLLGIRGPTVQDTVTDKRVSLNWWEWQVGAPDTDGERYRVISNGSVDATAAVEAPNSDPVEILSVGPLGFGAGQWPDGRDRFILNPGDTVTVSFALVGGEPVPHEGRTAFEDIVFNAEWAQTAFDLNFNIPVPPPSPTLRIFPAGNRITLRWGDLPESFIDPKSRTMDFEGYRVYVSESKQQEEFRLVREYDIVDSVFYNTGLEEIIDPMIDGEDTLTYRYDITEVRDGFKYWVAVTSFDTGSPEVASLESGVAQNRRMVIPGSASAGPSGIGPRVKVFPNPYRGDAVWDGALSRDRYLWFINLPKRCTIRITTLSGDLVDTIEFDGDAYDAREIRGIFDPTDPFDPDRDLPELSGGMAAWDLISRSDQGVATGLYLFSVKDRDTGETQTGKFMVLK